MSKEEENQEFRVTDKRLFREDGEPRQDAGESGAPKETGTPPPQDREKTPKGAEPPPGTGAQIDFPSYLLSYYTQGLVLLGEVPNPYTNKKEEDSEGARHIIDILTMLQERTSGNLDADEEKLLDNILYELRMKFMAKTSRIKL